MTFSLNRLESQDSSDAVDYLARARLCLRLMSCESKLNPERVKEPTSLKESSTKLSEQMNICLKSLIFGLSIPLHNRGH